MQSLFQMKKTLSVMLTYQCTAACTDCGTLSAPEVKESISLPTALDYITQAANLGFGQVVFTGGEATLRWKDLLAGIAHAKSLSLGTRLVTNAYWATRTEEARRRISELRQVGLDEINFSTGDEHTRFIPIERIVNAIVAASETAMSISVMVELRKERSVSRATLLGALRDRSFEDERLRSISITESPWMPIDPSRTGQYRDGQSATQDNADFKQGCDSVLTTYTLQGNGNIGACCGLGMRLIPELNVGKAMDGLADLVAESEADLVKLLIRFVGPHRLLDWASRKDPAIAWEGMYAHHCQACLRLYTDPALKRVVQAHAEELRALVRDAVVLQRRHRRIFLAQPEGVSSDKRVVAEM